MDLKSELKQFISEDLLSGQHDLSDDDNLLMDGLIDSVGVMRLVSFIEESLGISVPPEDFMVENFRSINTIGDYLYQRKREIA